MQVAGFALFARLTTRHDHNQRTRHYHIKRTADVIGRHTRLEPLTWIGGRSWYNSHWLFQLARGIIDVLPRANCVCGCDELRAHLFEFLGGLLTGPVACGRRTRNDWADCFAR